MEFEISEDSVCTSCVLEPLTGGEEVKIENIVLIEDSAEKIMSIMDHGVTKRNQKMTIAIDKCVKEEFEKLDNK